MLFAAEWMFFGELKLCADAYIEKPCSPEYLQVQIGNLLLNRAKIKVYFVSSTLVHIKSMAYTKTDELFLEKVNEVTYNNIVTLLCCFCSNLNN